jgi:dTDP-4-dehydrorhamnose reductase
MKILVTGSGGMLGSAVVPYFREKGHVVNSTSRRKNSVVVDQVLDVTDFDSYKQFIEADKPDLILHLAAETSLEFCEENPDKAYATNAIGTYNAAILSNTYDIKLVYISTAGVFDGKKKEPYTEFDEPNPIMVYGRSKFEGEKYVREHCNKYYIVRAGWMVGGLEKDKKFVSLIVNQVIEGKKEIFAVNDKFGAPTYAPYFAENLMTLVNTEFYGTYHMVCEGYGSRYDVAKEIISILGKENEISLTPVGSDHFKETYYAPRPESECLRNYMLHLRGINQMGDWKKALAQYVKDLFHSKQ